MSAGFAKPTMMALLFLIMTVQSHADTCSSDITGGCSADVSGLLQTKVNVSDLESQDSGTCAKWCAKNSRPDFEKCQWGACSGCDVCLSISTSTTSTSRTTSTSTSSIQVKEGVSYGSVGYQKMDLYMGRAQAPPVVLAYHGGHCGEWKEALQTTGNCDTRYKRMHVACLALAEAGITCLAVARAGAINLAHKANLLDAVRWASDPTNSQVYGFDHSKLFVLGYSMAGALVGMFQLYPMDPIMKAVKGVILVSGVFEWQPKSLQEGYKYPPVLMMAANDDWFVPWKKAVDLYDKLVSQSPKVETRLVIFTDGTGHSCLLRCQNAKNTLKISDAVFNRAVSEIKNFISNPSNASGYETLAKLSAF